MRGCPEQIRSEYKNYFELGPPAFRGLFRKRTLANLSTGLDSLAFDDTVSPRRNSIQTFNMFMLSELRENHFFDNETPLNPYCSF